MTVNELLELIFRWAHLIAGIMWIGNSMLFNWLDRNLVAPPADDAHRLSQGKIYMVHSGAFYEVEKKLLEPGQLPTQLHWFKWQNGITWMTGIALMIVVFYWNTSLLVSPAVAKLGAAEAIAISAGSLAVGWAVYDLIWRLFEKQPVIGTVLSFVLLFGAAWGYTELFSSRAAYIQTGVLMGTIMTGNVWMRILPSQRELIAATKGGREQDASLSMRAKTRSIHNNYLTFPLLFIMLSQHFSRTYSHHLNWLILIAIMISGAGVRHFMNVRYAGKAWLWPALAMGAIGIVAVMGLTRIKESRPPAPKIEGVVGFDRVQAIVSERCVSCHSSHPTDPVFPVAPLGIKMDTAEEIAALASRIHERAVVAETMPALDNRTGMTPTERAELKSWFAAGAKTK